MKSRLRRWVFASVVGICGLAAPWGALAQSQLQQQELKPYQFASRSQADPLAEQVETAIDISSRRYLVADVHTPWQIMHGVLALRMDFQIKENGQKVNAIQWMANGAKFRNEDWFEATAYGGRPHPYSQPYAFEGHPNQFLAILATANVPLDYQFRAGNRMITMQEMVNNAQMEIKTGEEVSWSLWGLSHYLGADAQWVNQHGEPWSIERLAQIETRASVNDGACGGTHGLFALSYARNMALKTGRPLRGAWLEADHKIRQYTEAARALQNADGNFSANFFQGRNATSDYNTQLATSGHTLEFLMMALPDARLREDWVRRGVAAVSQGLIDHRKEAIECGPLYHALSGLIIYRDRTQPKPTVTEEPQVTNSDPQETGSGLDRPSSEPSIEEQEKAAAEAKLTEEKLAEAKRAEEEKAEAKRAESKRLEAMLTEAKAKRFAAEAALAVAKMKRAEAERMRAAALRAEAEAQRAETEARQAEIDALKAETEARQSVARSETDS